jgi:hypothetical protein
MLAECLCTILMDHYFSELRRISFFAMLMAVSSVGDYTLAVCTFHSLLSAGHSVFYSF